MINQRTLAKTAQVTGIGVHSGKKVTLKLHPAEANFGIQFIRTDVAGSKPQKAHALSVGATTNNTTIGSGREAVHTVEHLLSAFYGLGINNVLCEIDGPEMPIMDGSSGSYVFLLKETGIRTLNASKKFIVILEKIRVEKDGAWAQIEPCASLIIDSTILFAHPQIKKQRKVFEFTCENYINEISRARTFGFLKDADYLRRMGLAKGASLDNTIVLDDYRVVNPEGLRFATEFVRHKILDTIGDLSLLGFEIAGKITTYKSGHHINNLLCREILANPNCYEIVNASSLKTEAREAFILPAAISLSH
jgi:UDP-3-O-[3-hydroxymyristoyl] N-acetylglucosamine deacetylase